jgi:hypothetical protein
MLTDTLRLQKEYYILMTTVTDMVVETGGQLDGTERHILEQLVLWKDYVGSVEEFRTRKEQALAQGWKGSGPIRESRALSSRVRDLEEKLAQRLLAEKMGH